MEPNTAVCPDCEADVTFPAGIMANELFACPDCGVELEAISLDPAKVDYAPKAEEDWGE